MRLSRNAREEGRPHGYRCIDVVFLRAGGAGRRDSPRCRISLHAPRWGSASSRNARNRDRAGSARGRPGSRANARQAGRGRQRARPSRPVTRRTRARATSPRPTSASQRATRSVFDGRIRRARGGDARSRPSVAQLAMATVRRAAIRAGRSVRRSCIDRERVVGDREPRDRAPPRAWAGMCDGAHRTCSRRRARTRRVGR